jgi:YegS/Rv2252/BmrU family lipid kinase
VSDWWVVVNPAAGRGRDLQARTKAALAALGIGHELRVSPSPEAVTDVVGEGVARGFTNFVSVGGDGTAHLVLNGLMATTWEAPPTLAILPAGSGGDFIRTFALPRKLEGAAAHLVDEARYPADVGLIEGSFGSRYFLNVANAGVAARSAAVAARLPQRLGAARYTAAFWLALGGFAAAEVHVQVDDKSLWGDLLNVVIANGQFFGGGLNVAPRATVQDGLFDVQLFAGPRRQATVVMPRVLFGTHLTHRSVRRATGSTIGVDCPDSWPIEADGEVLGSGPISVQVLPQAVLFKI